MPRLLELRPSAPRCAASMLAVACAFGLSCASAQAQSTALIYPDPFAPQLEAAPQTFQKQTEVTPGATGLPRMMQPIAPPTSGAGSTGFNASNAPPRPAKKTTVTSGVDIDAQASAGAAPQPISPYQEPIPPLPGDAALAKAPGAPPVSEIEPIRRPLKKRNKAHPDEPIDPYAPVGIRAGAFDIYPAIEIGGGYDSNPGAVQGGSGAAFYTVAPEVQVRSNWSRHQLNVDLRGSYTGYHPDTEPTLSRPYLNGNVDGRIDVSRDNRINLRGSVLVTTDNPGSPNLQAGLAKLPIYVDYGGSAGFTHKFNRLEIGITGTAERTSYQNSVLTDGTIVSNKDQNYNQFGFALRGGYELTPGVKPFVEVSADTRIHDIEPDQNGFFRNSKGITGKVGTSVELTHELTGQVAIGYTRRIYDDPRFGPLNALIGDASLVWTADALNTVTLTASSSVGESTIPGVSGIIYRNVGLQFDHAFRRWLIGTLKFGVGLDTYKGGASSDTTGFSSLCLCVITTPGETAPTRQDLLYLVGLGLTYKVSRELQIKGEFQQNWLRSNVAGADYNDSIFLLGVRVQR